jgi:transcriptional antiterminator NusG
MKNWVILFVQTGAEERLTRMLKEMLNADEYLPFLPVKETFRRSKGVIHKERKLLFPGYVFIQTDIEADLIANKLKLALMNITGQKYIYSILHYGDNKKDVAVHDKEHIYLERLFNSDFCVMGSVGFIEGDMIRVTSGALIGMESRIKRINRHKREAVLEFEMFGALRKVTLMLEVIEKIK